MGFPGSGLESAGRARLDPRIRDLTPIVALALLVGLPALAQDKLEPPDLTRYLRWGPVRARPGIGLSNLGYDNNIFLSSGDNVIGDYTATLSPRLDGLVLFGDGPFLTFREQLEYTAYFSYTDQSYYDNRASARLTVPFRRFGLLTDGTLNRIRERPVDLDDIRPIRHERGAGVGFLVRPGWRTEVELRLGQMDYEYSDPDSAVVDSGIARLSRAEGSLNLRVRYRALGRTSLVFDGLRKTIDFDEPEIVDGAPVARNTDERRTMVGVELAVGGPLTGTLLAGWDAIDARDPALADLSEVAGEAHLVYRLNGRTRFEIDGVRLPGFSTFTTESYYLLSELGLRPVYYFNRLWGFEAALRRGWLAFPASSGAIERQDDLLRYDVGVRLRVMENSMGRRVEYWFRVGRYHRDSNLDGFDRDQSTVGFGATAGF